MHHCSQLIHRAVRQMLKANRRGDLHSALRWIIIIERQLDIIDRLAGAPLHQRVWRYRDDILAAFEKAAAKLTGCLEVQLVTGEFDYFVKLRIQGIDSFNEMHSAQLIGLPGVRQVRTFVCLKEVFETTVLPVMG